MIKIFREEFVKPIKETKEEDLLNFMLEAIHKKDVLKHNVYVDDNNLLNGYIVYIPTKTG